MEQFRDVHQRESEREGVGRTSSSPLLPPTLVSHPPTPTCSLRTDPPQPPLPVPPPPPPNAIMHGPDYWPAEWPVWLLVIIVGLLLLLCVSEHMLSSGRGVRGRWEGHSVCI